MMRAAILLGLVACDEPNASSPDAVTWPWLGCEGEDLSGTEGAIFVASGASGSGDGSPERPVPTVADGLLLGTSLVIGPGTYIENVEVPDGAVISGTCREKVVIRGAGTTVDDPAVHVAIAADAQAEVRDLTITGGTGRGLLLESGHLLLERVDVVGNERGGISSLGANARIELQDVYLADNLPMEDGTLGYGLALADGASFSVRQTVVSGNRSYGILVTNDAVGTLEGVEITNTTISGGGYGFGLAVESGAAVEASNLVFNGNQQIGLFVADGTVTLTNGEIADTTAGPDGRAWGALIQEAGHLQLTDVAVRHSYFTGIVADGAGSTVDLSGVEILDTQPTTLGYGWGLTLTNDATGTVTDSVISGNSEIGVYVGGSEASLTITNSEVRDTLIGDRGTGYGLYIADSADLTATGLLVENNPGLGLSASGNYADEGTLSVVQLTDCTISNTFADSLESGFGVQLTDGVFASIIDTVIEDSVGVGLLAQDDGTTVVADGLTVRRSLADGTGHGYGVTSSFGADILVYRSVVEESHGCGVSIAYGSTGYLENTIVREGRANVWGLGYGIQARDDSYLGLVSVEVEGSYGIGVRASSSGSMIEAIDTTIRDTRRTSFYSASVGINAYNGADIYAENLVVADTEGPGVLAQSEGDFFCWSCALYDNEFAGAIAHNGTVELYDTSIAGTTQDDNEGGGIGAYAYNTLGEDTTHPPRLLLDTCTISEHEYAAAWLVGTGDFEIRDSTLSGSSGHEKTAGAVQNGNAVYATGGASADDILLVGNTFHDSQTHAVRLQGSAATLIGNAYADNAVDLLARVLDGDQEPTVLDEDPSIASCTVNCEPTADFRFAVYYGDSTPDGTR